MVLLLFKRHKYTQIEKTIKYILLVGATMCVATFALLQNINTLE